MTSNRALRFSAFIVLLTSFGAAQEKKTEPPPAMQPVADVARALTARHQKANSADTAGVQRALAPGGRREGIAVHGHWTIDVRNPDGSLATHTEFENALFNDGYSITPVLGDVLGRSAIIGRWGVFLMGGACNMNGPAGCWISEAGSVCPDNPCAEQVFTSLQVTVPGDGSAVLQGGATATFAAPITDVVSFVTECPRPTTPSYGLPATCGDNVNAFPLAFTMTTLPSPVSVVAGQSIQVKVTFTFS